MRVERAALMGVEIVLHKGDRIGLRKLLIELTHEVDVLLGSSARIDLSPAPARVRLESHEQCAAAVFAVMVILTLGFSRLHG